jgi:hypothetical protein
MYPGKELQVIVSRARGGQVVKWQPTPVEAALQRQAKTTLEGPLASVGTFSEIHL